MSRTQPSARRQHKRNREFERRLTALSVKLDKKDAEIKRLRAPRPPHPIDALSALTRRVAQTGAPSASPCGQWQLCYEQMYEGPIVRVTISGCGFHRMSQVTMGALETDPRAVLLTLLREAHMLYAGELYKRASQRSEAEDRQPRISA